MPLTRPQQLGSLAGLTVAAAAFIVAVPAPAQAAGDDCGTTCGAQTPETSGSTVAVQVTGTMVKGGSDGSSGSGGTTVQVESPCGYQDLGMTGKEYYDEYGGTGGNHVGGGGGAYEPPDSKEHKNDKKGTWYYTYCNWTKENEKFTDQWQETHDWVYVMPGEPAPVVDDLPPEMLLEAAEEAMEVPEPEFAHNPDRDAYPATIVNLPTWFWMTDRTFTGHVTASAGGNSATVQAGMQDFSVASSAGDSTGPCADGGTPWTSGQPSGAASECSITFPAPSEALDLTATSTWGLSWEYNGEPQGELPPISGTWTDQVTVGEIHSIVQDVG